MRYAKKMLALVIAAAMVLAMSSMVWAANSGDDTSFTITIDNAVEGETYSAYKVFDVTYSGDVTPTPTPVPEATDIPGTPDPTNWHTAYAYTISTGSAFWTDLTTNSTANPVTVADGVYSLTSFGIKFVPTTTTGVYNVLPIDADNGVTEAQAQALAAYLATKLTGKTAVASDTAASDTHDHDDYATGSLELDVTTGGPGYYFVDTTTGSLCSLDTTEPSATIREKNSIPGVDKDVFNTASGEWGETDNAQIGDTVSFMLNVNDGKGTDTAITVYDIMDDGLTWSGSVTVYKKVQEPAAAGLENYYELDGSAFMPTEDQEILDNKDYYEIVPAADYTLKTSEFGEVKDKEGNVVNPTFAVIFPAAYVLGLDENDEIVIWFTAVLNENATFSTPEINKSILKYSNQTTEITSVNVKTYKVAILKYDLEDEDKGNLAGAIFELTDNNGVVINLAKISATRFRVTDEAYVEGKKITIDVDGTATEVDVVNRFTTVDTDNIVIEGLDCDYEYYLLKELHAPDGYNVLERPFELSVTDDNQDPAVTVSLVNTDNSGVAEIANAAGAELPSTGGMGTTVLYVIGAALVIGAAVLLVTRRRMSANR